MALSQVSVNNHRYYTDGGIYYPSPTTVLKLYFDPMFAKWSQSKVNVEYRNQRMIVGSRVHEIVNNRLLKTPFEAHPLDDTLGIPEMCNIVHDYLSQFDIILSEECVKNDAIKVAGTLDYVVRNRFSDQFILMDVKTVSSSKKTKTKAVLDGHFMQLAAYHTGLKQCYPDMVISSWQVLIVSPTNLKIETISEREDMLKYISDFLTLRKRYMLKYGK